MGEMMGIYVWTLRSSISLFFSHLLCTVVKRISLPVDTTQHNTTHNDLLLTTNNHGLHDQNFNGLHQGQDFNRRS
jgi:hypothetical protein